MMYVYDHNADSFASILTGPPQPLKLYIIGSLRNPSIPLLGNRLRLCFPGAEVFDDWHGAGPEADDHWKTYEQTRGRSYVEALDGHAAKQVFGFDKEHLDSSTHVILTMPSGRSGHLEFGYSMGMGKKGFVLIDDPDRWDVMYQFATKVVLDDDALIEAIKETI